jgi:D-alanyl-lipoteichoic acid acyltransferase DltB (MBOAT superfamily)
MVALSYKREKYMQVNSLIFWFFFLVVFIAYYLVRKSAKAQNWILLLGSYFFYGYAEVKMLPVIIIATLVFYVLGLQIEKYTRSNEKLASGLTTLGVVAGVGLLVYFKYLNFLVEEFAHLFQAMGFQANIGTLNILMPLGVSYFTFKLMSYVIEVHRGKMEASRDLLSFSVFVSFFPTIMAGPIDRPNQFLPQLQVARPSRYENFADGSARILWGMFMKMCIADRVAPYVDAVFTNYVHHNGATIVVACIFYTMQSYTDFCGYSNMAIGVGKLLGLTVQENFNRPFFGQNMAELWRRWHISLTTWITDYIFMPLNVKFRDLGMWGLYLATMINMVVVGAWHGANWTYVFFGVYHGIVVSVVTRLEKPRKQWEKKYTLKGRWYYQYPRMLLTFALFSISTAMIRSTSITDYFAMIGQIFHGWGSVAQLGQIDRYSMLFVGLAYIALIFKEWKDENKKEIHFLHSPNIYVRLATYVVLISFILLVGELDGPAPIYFQF